jgi:hypothetical protein
MALRPHPVHDWTSHAADSFRYLAMTLDGPAAQSGFTERSSIRGRESSDLRSGRVIACRHWKNFSVVVWPLGPGSSLATLARPGHEIFVSRASVASALARAKRDPGPSAKSAKHIVRSSQRRRLKCNYPDRTGGVHPESSSTAGFLTACRNLVASEDHRQPRPFARYGRPRSRGRVPASRPTTGVPPC